MLGCPKNKTKQGWGLSVSIMEKDRLVNSWVDTRGPMLWFQENSLLQLFVVGSGRKRESYQGVAMQTEKTKYEEKIEKGAENSVEVNSKDGSG